MAPARKSPPQRRKGPTVLAVERELAAIRERDSSLADSAIAASAIVMARGLDEVANSLTSQTMAQARLQAAMDRLHELAPAPEKEDKLDDLSARRAVRLSGAA